MKTGILTLALICTASACTVFAQTPGPSPVPSPSLTSSKSIEKGSSMREVWKSLSPEERQKLKSARETARNDPSVVEARKKLFAARQEFHDKMNTAMIKADSSLEPVLEKFKAARKEKMHRWEQKHPSLKGR